MCREQVVWTTDALELEDPELAFIPEDVVRTSDLSGAATIKTTATRKPGRNQAPQGVVVQT